LKSASNNAGGKKKWKKKQQPGSGKLRTKKSELGIIDTAEVHISKGATPPSGGVWNKGKKFGETATTGG